MLWSGYLLAASAPASDPIATAAGQILSYGVVGAFAVVLAIVLYRGTFVRAADAKADADARVAAARADLLRENEDLRQKLVRVEEQRDEALAFARDQLVPLLGSFTSATSSLLPVLQGLTAYRGEQYGLRGRDDDRERR